MEESVKLNSSFSSNLNYTLLNLENAINYEIIISGYKEIESIVSQLELCLADYDNKFHMDGISYSIFQIGKILSDKKKESDKNGK